MRLSDISVDEVSLVDKAANKRKFAFMKRDEKEVHKEIDKEMEIVEAQRILKAANINNLVVDNDEPTAEEMAQMVELAKSLNDLTATLKK